LPKVYEFRADGTYTGERETPFPPEKGKYILEGGNFALVPDAGAVMRYTVVFTQDRMGCIPVGKEHWLARWNDEDRPLMLRKLP
jgi:hypothetical protein